MKVGIFSKADGSLQTSYVANQPNQANYGGPWGRPDETTHLEIAVGIDDQAVSMVNGAVVEDAAKKAANAVAKQQSSVKAAVIKAKSACADLEVEFMAGNSILGIKVDGLAVKKSVLSALAGVSSALKVGDPDLVIAELKAIPAASHDAKYITDARLLDAANKMRAAMGLAAVTVLADA